MDSLPVELLQLLFEFCDAPAVRNLRLVCRTLADIGYEYLLPSHFTAVPYRDDIGRLHSIASHGRLRSSITSITLNFSKIDEYNARHTSFFQHWMQDPVDRATILQDAWMQYENLEKLSYTLPPFHSRSATLEDAFKQLPNLRELEVTYTKCPYPIEMLHEVFSVRTCRKRDRAQACKNMNAIVSATRHARLTSLTIDQLPLEIFRLGDDRRHWFDCARSFASLTRLDLVIDPPRNMYPNAQFRAINGLGHVLQFTPNLTNLSLRFHTYHAPMEKFTLSFEALLGRDFRWPKLTDLKLEGVSCSERDLRLFLARHGPTLERLRLGGRGLAKPFELSMGGIHLHEGTFRSLFLSLQGKLPKLQRFHMEGDFDAGEVLTPAAAARRSRYNFHAVTDEDWAELAQQQQQQSQTRLAKKTIDSVELERFLVHGGEFPRLATPEAQQVH